MFLLVAHFRDDRPDGAAGTGEPEVPSPAELLAAAPECRWLRYARSTEDVRRRVLVAEFGTAADYRAALSPFHVRESVVPWLSTADVAWTGLSEVLLSADGGSVDRHVPTVDPDGG
ncbi:antibiotic biosynthesis monooxygenase [Nakamurella endophytica]|uniref:Antibiotic biosynthesis monooxygenase n=1 Tax=Nakamurella endophytica TaxID=1748367 RepID=A0A917T1W7_9ACTN|nr:antibiotic biosynthesis monooxygenase [Nakamurella endophytica]GGM06319.1 hypothetical protein GCM10011594_28100 [Nakamurella endophytica]